MARPKDPKTDAIRAQIIQLLQEGVPGTEIAEITGKHAPYISRIKKELEGKGIDLSKRLQTEADDIALVTVHTSKSTVARIESWGFDPSAFATQAFHSEFNLRNDVIEQRIQERLAEMKLHGEKRSKGVPNLCPSCMSIALKTNVYSKIWHCKDCENTGMFSVDHTPVVFGDMDFYLEELDSMVTVSWFDEDAGEYSVGNKTGTFHINWETLAVSVDETSADESPAEMVEVSLPRGVTEEAFKAYLDGDKQKAFDLLPDRTKTYIGEMQPIIRELIH